MKIKTPLLLFCCILLQSFTNAQSNDKTLEFYRQYSIYTNPGEYESMYSKLPDSLASICKLIKSQLIHPIADLPQYADLIPKERSYEDLKYPTVSSILSGLKAYNPEGLILNRKPADRLVVSCRYHAILLASILKHKGIPSRVRYGFASYLFPEHHIYHVICEVWNSEDKRWMLVDPDRQKIDFSPEQFEFATDVWVKNQNDKLKAGIYGVPNWWGPAVILDALCHDFASVLGNEPIYFDRPPISADSTMDLKKLSSNQIDLLNRLSTLMSDVDANLYELQNLYKNNAELQFSNSIAVKPSNVLYNKTITKSEVEKPIIEWANFPAGTFIMGNPLSEGFSCSKTYIFSQRFGPYAFLEYLLLL